MKTKVWLVGVATMMVGVLTVGQSQAQDAGQLYISGRVIGAPYFDDGLRLLFSQSDNTFGTSRSAAMGGAFASLGADLSSASINPAGLGMYQSSDWGITAALSIDGMRTSADMMRPGALAAGGSRTSFGLNNVGAAYNLFNRSGALTSMTLGFTYNRAANFNSRTRVETFGEDSSIADMFQHQLNLAAGDGLRPGALNPSANPFENLGIYLDEWGAVLGYQTGLVGLNDEGGFGYFDGALPSDSYFGSVTRGGINEYGVSLGANISNYLYLGATVGATQINYSEETSYEEFYQTGAMFDMMWFDQTTIVSGSGVTAKFGLIARPLPALRIGVAYHLPTYYTLEKAYEGVMGSVDGQGETSFDTGNTLRDQQRFSSAPRLLAGVSGIIAERAIVALDWEATWYNKISVRDDVVGSKGVSAQLYKPAHTFRAGFEFLATDVVSLRAGGAYKMDFLRSGAFDPGRSDNPAARDGFSVTAGVGFNLGLNGYFDVAYVYNRARMTDYDFYFYDDGAHVASQYDLVGSGGSGGGSGVGIGRDGELLRSYTPVRRHHMITFTLGSRF
ncbi:MAG: hypothetical protein LBV38_01995 [Alistipes sp.]|nr:hypothetical protein [Alistipes sp.]